jgi:hypothetical protein
MWEMDQNEVTNESRPGLDNQVSDQEQSAILQNAGYNPFWADNVVNMENQVGEQRDKAESIAGN